MKPDNPRRYLLFFCLLVAAGTWFDIYSKNLVFQDLGFPASKAKVVEGAHEVFSTPSGVQGQSVLYMDNWIVFQLYTNFNHGALWGMGQGFSLLFGLFGICAVTGILLWAFKFEGLASFWLTLCLGLILAGTFGNLYDRAGLHGYQDEHGNTIRAVRDFLFFRFGGRDGYYWPIFNFADAFLVVGAAILFLHSFFTDEPKEKKSIEQQENVSREEVSEPAV